MPSLGNSNLIDRSKKDISIRTRGLELGMTLPFSASDFLNHIDSQSFSGKITTPGIESLGASIDLTIRSNGDYDIRIHAHNSGAPSFEFRVVVVLVGSSGDASLGQDTAVVVLFETKGDVEGTLTPTPNPRRDFDFPDSGNRSTLRDNWLSFRSGSMHGSLDFKHTGLVEHVEDMVKENVEIIGAAVLGLPPVGAIAVIATDFAKLTKIRFLGPSGVVGLAAAGADLYVYGPTGVFPAFVAGTLGADILLPSSRKLMQVEIDLARRVFGDTIPYDRVILTNLTGIGGRPFTIFGVDGSIIVNIGVGTAFTNAATDTSAGKAGQIFIHEMTHVWQLTNASLEAYICKAIIITKAGEVLTSQQTVYSYGSASTPWNCFNAEQQASVVEEWYSGATTRMRSPQAGRKAEDARDPYFHFISDFIRPAVG